MINLKRARGDLVQMADQGQFDCIVHGCNCFRTMGAGIARQIAQKWPEAAEADRIIPMIEQFAKTHDATLVSYTDQKRVDAFHAKYNRRKD